MKQHSLQSTSPYPLDGTDIQKDTTKMTERSPSEIRELNVVPTNEAQNMGAALECNTNRDAELLFRALQHANGRGTTSAHYAELERRWKIKQQTPCREEITA